MMNTSRRCIAVLLSLLLGVLPVMACAVTDTSYVTTVEGVPVYRSEFETRLNFYADGFPQDGAAHYADWQQLFSRLSGHGTVTTQRMLDPFSRVSMDGALALDGEDRIPLSYDGYYSFRYIRSAALGDESIHFQMNNFLEFMLKGYYFMDLPTPTIGLALYPEEAVFWKQQYQSVIEEYIPQDAKTVSYQDLYDMCLALDDIVNCETNEWRAYFYVTAALVDLGESDRVLERLGTLEDTLDVLDPDGDGLVISRSAQSVCYNIGGVTVLEKTETDDGSELYFTLTDADDYVYTAEVSRTSSELHISADMSYDDESLLGAAFDLTGMHAYGDLGGRGTAVLTLTGSGLREELPPITLMWDLTRTAAQLPFTEDLTVDWIHPETGEKAIGIEWHADMREADRSELPERAYDNQDDFFHLNEGVMEGYKETVLPALAAHALPLLTAIPSGVYSDIIAFMNTTGFLAFFGIE